MRSVALLAVVLFAAGCDRAVEPPDAAAVPPPATRRAATAPPAHTGPPLTDDDYRAFGRELEKAVTAGDVAAVNQLLRLPEVIERCLADFGLSADESNYLRTGLVKKFTEAGFAVELTQRVVAGGRFRARPYQADGQYRLLIRMISAHGRATYRDLILSRYPDGDIGVADIVDLATGESFTVVVRRPAYAFLGDRPGAAGRMTALDQEWARCSEAIASFNGHLNSRRYREALDSFRRLPVALRGDKWLRARALKAAAGVGEDEYLAELESFQKAFPGDSAADFHGIDYFTLKGRYDDALAALDRLAARIGGDPYLTSLRANTLALAGRLVEAKREAEKAVADDPTLTVGYMARALAAVKGRDHADARDWLQKLVETGAGVVDLAEMRKDPDYAAFVASDEFPKLEAWPAGRAKK